jgi:hypothetical protein
VTHVDFHCGRCRLRGCIQIGEGEAGANLTIDAVNVFIAAAHREVSPDCQATGKAVQILRIGADVPGPRRAARDRARAARSN